jgi:acylpyruvate hydrolase
MKVARVRTAAGPVMAVVEGDTLYAATVDGRTFDDLPALLLAADAAPERIDRGAALGRPAEAALLAPVGRPRKIICVGLNYRAHAAESGQPEPPAPPLFPKWDNALAGPFDDVPLPAVAERVDWEAELAFVFGRRCRTVPAAEAARALFGFTAANDVSARDFQMRTSQWTAGKTFDGFCPLGPWIVTADELGPAPDLAIRGRLNGEPMQDSRTSDLIYGVPELVAFITAIMTVEPGDLVLTGTPAGVGSGRRPPRFLRPGDVYEVEIERIGAIRNRFVAERAE